MNASPATRSRAGRRKAWKKAAQIKDEEIDFSDIPELTDEWCGRAVRGKFYRPVKEIVSISLDKDVLAFYRSQGAGYQTRINDTLRAATPIQATRPKRRGPPSLTTLGQARTGITAFTGRWQIRTIARAGTMRGFIRMAPA
jgi:uncharacterized protein (DUF4415 family)